MQTFVKLFEGCNWYEKNIGDEFSVGINFNMLKFGYSEKATKFEKIFHLQFDDTK